MEYSETFITKYLESFDRLKRKDRLQSSLPLPTMKDIKNLTTALMALFFPGQRETMDEAVLKLAISESYHKATSILRDAAFKAIRYENPEKSQDNCLEEAEAYIKMLTERLPEIRRMLKLDAEAGFAGDPAARSVHEVILCYPALHTLSVHRVAHELFKEGLPIIPRMMNEIAHSQTGIDIHPGAEIGKSFFIDHGTGVVIGETTVIGNNVKLYQGVTLGALSIPNRETLPGEGTKKRHPTIEDNVTIYAGSTILGNITIGHDTIIASNAWIKEDIPAESMVITARPEIKVRPIRRN